ncbi:hypothetical protein Cmtc_08460 [Cupriavidus sp. TKC]|uniref:hypothetical protein n=1 Tax=Cupriavidus sp. TKC TaxID=2880159 RepID=UPI0025A8B5D3|nr:hypothetical protein [Cupriavidus sp. TKC]GMG89626.1 hypothetical protein Cmtc_08460 [Cupriavidus sp. TKC]
MDGKTSTRIKVIDALLAGREVCAGPFSREIGCADTTVTKILKDLGEALTTRVCKTEPGKRRLYYRVADREAVTEMRNRVRRGSISQNLRPMPPKAAFDALLATWGIRCPKNHDLPRLVHRSEPESEELFSQLFAEEA